MKPINILVLLIVWLAFLSPSNSVLLKKSDPRLRAEAYPLKNGGSLIISNHEPVITTDGVRFREKPKHRLNSHFKKEKIKSPSYSKIDKEEDKNFCLGGTEENDPKQRLVKFSKSKCFPVVLAPGIMGTRLRALVTDCQLINENVKSYCGFSNSYLSQSCKSNQTEFDLWIAIGQNSPASLTASDRCFGHLIGLNLTELELADGSLPEDLPDPDGIDVTWYGNTPESYKASKCGANAIRNLMNSMSGEGKGNAIGEVTEVYSGMIDYFEGMGYTIGVNLFPMPYDWRRNAGKTDLTLNLKRTLELAKRINNKRVVIVTHSFGSLNTLEVLNRMTTAEKEDLIERFVPIGPPFAGSFESNKKAITSTDEFSLLITGFQMNDLRPILTSVSGLWDLFIKDVFDTQKSQGWAVDLQERLKAERENLANASYWQNMSLPFSWFPNPTQRCTTQRGDEQAYCGLHMYDYFTNPLLTVNKTPDGEVKKTYSASFRDSIEIMEKYGVRSDAEINFILSLDSNNGKITSEKEGEIWGPKKLIPKNRVEGIMNLIKKNNLGDLKNPEVPVTLIFGANIRTPTTMTIFENQNPRTFTNLDKTFPGDKMNLEMGFGDETVATDGALTPLLKWGWEFDKTIGKYPMQVIEYCSINRQALSLGSKNKYTARYFAPKKNTYNGLPCDNKNHGSLIADPYVIKFVASILKSGSNSILTPEISTLKTEDLENLIAVCPGLNGPRNNIDLLQYGINPKNNPTEKLGILENVVATSGNLASSGLGLAKTVKAISGNAVYKTYGFLKNQAASYFFSKKINLLAAVDDTKGLRLERKNRTGRRADLI